MQDFFDQYKLTKQWQTKVTVMELYHLMMVSKIPKWTLTHTAIYFECSVGLVSENLRLAKLIHNHPELGNYETRQDAVKQIGRYSNGTQLKTKVG